MSDKPDDLKMLMYAFDLIGEICQRHRIEPPAVNLGFKDAANLHRFEAALKSSPSWSNLLSRLEFRIDDRRVPPLRISGIVLTVSEPDRRAHVPFT